jgi:hypothetical protein
MENEKKINAVENLKVSCKNRQVKNLRKTIFRDRCSINIRYFVI